MILGHTGTESFFCSTGYIMNVRTLLLDPIGIPGCWCSLLMLISHLCFRLTNMFCCNFQIAVPVWTHVLPLFCFWHTTGPMITEKHDKHMSETFMWILPNLLYEALCTGIPPLPCIFSIFILTFKAIQSVCSFAIFYLFAIFDGRIPQVVRLGWWSIA